MLHENLCLKNN